VDQAVLRMDILEVRRGARTAGGFEPVVQRTSRGEIESRYYPVEGATAGVILVGGAGGGFDTPVKGWLYPRLCKRLQRDGIACLRVSYRRPNDLEEAELDVMAGVNFLETEGMTSVGLVGHSFGGAVVIGAAAAAPAVRTCVAMSTQTYGAIPAAATLGPRCSLLVVHGGADEVLPPACGRYVYTIAKEPRELRIKENVRHGLDEWADELPGLLREWLRARLVE
jgi:alpha/beta superfamily hydrolase